jgi:hypothetical protein
MSDYVPKTLTAKISGLGPKAQKLQAMREKAAQQKGGGKAAGANAPVASFKAKDSFATTKKNSFQRKAT